MIVVKDGKPEVSILLGGDATETEVHACKELNKYIKKMTGVALPVERCKDIGRKGEKAGGCFILIGNGKTNPVVEVLEKDGLVCLSEEILGIDGYVVQVVKQGKANYLLLGGNADHSCLYAVYHLLQRYFYCGFFEDGDQVPHWQTISLSDEISDREKPYFVYRSFIGQCTAAYGTQWWTMKEWKEWLDYGAKMRYNIANIYLHLGYSGVAVLAWKRLQAPIELSEFQRKQIELYQGVVRYARLLGMKVTLPIDYATSGGAWGTQTFDQFMVFYDKYKDRVAFKSLEWCNQKSFVVDSRDPMFADLIKISVEEVIRLFGTDHLYTINAPSEERDTLKPDEIAAVVESGMRTPIRVVEEIDPEASFIMNTWAFVAEEVDKQRARRAPAVLKVIKEENIIIQESDIALCPVFHKKGYFFGKPWFAGVIHAGGAEPAIFGYLSTIIQTVQQQIVRESMAKHCIGFFAVPESRCHNFAFYNCIAELAWNPMQVVLGDYLRRFAVARYGPEYGQHLIPMVYTLNASVYNTAIPDAQNRPFYRLMAYRWTGDPVSQEEMMAKQEPDVHSALVSLVNEADSLSASPLYRRDLVDLAKQYLGLRCDSYKNRVVETAHALQTAKGEEEETARKELDMWAGKLEAAMMMQAKLVGSIPYYRLRTYEEMALRWPQAAKNDDNLKKIRKDRTILLSEENWSTLLDYWSEDLTELILFYYWPRVKARIDELRSGVFGALEVDSGKGAEGLLMNFAPRHGYSADERIVKSFVQDGYQRDSVEYYDGDIRELVLKLLKQFPPAVNNISQN